ncbi:MAG: endolytic transglycosylase MltG [Alphaproteobacteria bacterium]|nr:endolytic transglycosylase MltG [Alphaproteobacteria bacterium]
MLKKLFNSLLSLAFLAIVVGVIFFVAMQKKYTHIYHLSSSQEVMIERGVGGNRVAQLLAERGIIDSPLWFRLFTWRYHMQDSLKAGEYSFGGSLSYQQVFEKLISGDVIIRSLTIPEGKALAEIRQIVADNPYLSGDITLALKEGEVLPETYHFTRGESRNSILEKARQAMKKTLAEVYGARQNNLPLKSADELLILASIVEKETGVAAERAKVASVFINRLNLGMKLQTDPTVIYAVTQGKMNLNRPIYKRDLAYDSPYNTYVYSGLPPAPICSPGKAAILAAAHPEKTPYLYFVADGVTGGHRFAKTLKEHNANVAHYRKGK